MTVARLTQGAVEVEPRAQITQAAVEVASQGMRLTPTVLEILNQVSPAARIGHVVVEVLSSTLEAFT